MAQPPGAHREQNAGSYQRAPRHQRRWGLLREDEFKTDTARFVQDAHRACVATSFYVAASVTHDVVIRGRENVSGYHPTLILCNHKRDLDSILLPAVCYFARGLRKPNTRIIYSLREDAFWPDFVESYLDWKGPLRLNVRPPLQLLKAYPMGYVRKRSDASRIEAQLAGFAALLDRGRDLYWTPEGGLSLDGTLEPFRAGFQRIIRASHAPLRILPVTIFYDFMTTGRIRCFIRFGPEYEVDRSLSKQALERQARLAILRQMTVNAGHLFAAVLRELAPGASLDRAELEGRLLAQARRLRRAGLALDGRLTSRWSLQSRVETLLGYLSAQGIINRRGEALTVGAGLEHPRMRYVMNELIEVEQELGLTSHNPIAHPS